MLKAGGEWGGRKWRRGTAEGYGISLGDDENVLKLTMVIVAQPCEYILTEFYTLGKLCGT